jgi:hypothetical protein
LYAEIFSNANFPDALLALDRELARETKQRGCPRCEGVLDVANYPRKPRGGPFALRDEHSRRLSLCCRREGCRKRGHTAFGALPRPARVPLGRRLALRSAAAGADAVATRRVAACRRRGPSHARALASLVGRAGRVQPCLRDRSRRLHATTRCGRAAHVAAGQLSGHGV